MSSPLVDHQLERFGLAGHIWPFNPDQVNPASYNLTLGTTAVIERPGGFADLDLSMFNERNPYMLEPGGWILTDVAEYVKIPQDHEAQVILRSSAARAGFDHALAGYVDPSYEGRLTLEFVNCLRYKALPMYPGQQLVQLRISKLNMSPDRGYDKTGRYQGAQEVEACKDPSILKTD